MDERLDLPALTEEALALYRQCRFVHREFWPNDCYKTRNPPGDVLAFLQEWEQQGEQFLQDPERFEVVEGGWDHEHCDVCSDRIEPGDWYWPNVDESVGQIDLCRTCYRRVMRLVRGSQDVAPDGSDK